MRPQAGTIPLGHAAGTRPRRERIEFSIIVPFHDQASALPHCLERLRRIGEQLAGPCEFLFVDGGSRDGGAEYLARQAVNCPQIRLLRLGRDAGRQAARTAGLDLARGDAVVVLDADLQAPTELIPPMPSARREGADVVPMRRRTGAGESLDKLVSTRPFYRALKRIGGLDIPADAGDLRLWGRKAADALQRLCERNRLRWAAVIGVASAVGGGMFGLWIAARPLLLREAVQGSSWLVPVISFFGGAQLLDEQFFVFLNSLGSERWDGVWLFVTHKFSWIPFYVFLMYLVYRHFGLKNMLIILVLIVLMITMTDQLSNLFKHVFERPRPCREEHLKEIIRYIAPRCGRYGYFSAHAASSTALAVFMGLLLRRIHKHLLFVLLFWASIVGFSRIYLGVHYPLDLLTGMVMGALVGLLIYKISQRVRTIRTLVVFGQVPRHPWWPWFPPLGNLWARHQSAGLIRQNTGR